MEILRVYDLRTLYLFLLVLHFICGTQMWVCKVEGLILLLLKRLLFQFKEVPIKLWISSNYKEIFDIIEEHGCFITLLSVILNTNLQAGLLQLLLYFFHPLANLSPHTGLA